VVPRFTAFLDRFPTLGALAAADEAEVLGAWSGLGYYRRARLLHRLAREVVAGGGKLPSTAAELERLPGIGPYTAAAIASLAFGERTPVLDGNVLRVGARVLGLDIAPQDAMGRRRILAWVRTLMEAHPPEIVNEALMELGAVVCRPSAPRCGSCPLEDGCRAAAEGRPEAYPRPRRQRAPEDHLWVAACCVDPDGRWLLRRIDGGPILRGLWLPPIGDVPSRDHASTRAVELAPLPVLASHEPLPEVRHGITHRRIRVIPVPIQLANVPAPGPGWRWADPHADTLPTSSLLAKLVRALEGSGRSGRVEKNE
jgi:A/G-specific adenine glycosylase